VLFLVSPAWLNSQWCVAECLLTKQLERRSSAVIVDAVLLDSLPTEMTAEWQLCDLTSGTERRTFIVHKAPQIVAIERIANGWVTGKEPVA